MNKYITGFLLLLIFTIFYLASIFNYAIFHTLSELFSNTHYIFASYLLISSLVLASIFHCPVFPGCFLEAKGFMPFKIISDHIICLDMTVMIIDDHQPVK